MSENKIRLSLILFFTIMLNGCVSGYKEFYQQANGATPEAIAATRVAPPTGEPIVERSGNSNLGATYEGYARRGYAMIGSSNFNSGHVESDAEAIAQAKIIGADLVLIVNPQYTNTVHSTMPIVTPTTTTSYTTGTATAYGNGRAVTAYGSGTTTTYGTTTNYIPIEVNRSDYSAAYFVKRRYLLGVVGRELNDSERKILQSNKGAAVEIVIANSPAYNADVINGDLIISINGDALSSEKDISDLVSKYRGQKVTLKLNRDGNVIDKIITLNN